MGIENLPKAKWSETGRQVILKQDWIDVEEAILSQSGGGSSIPPVLTWVDVTAVKVAAVADSPAAMLMSGFPNILHPGNFIAGASDRKYRINTSDTVMDFDVPASLWGTEKVSQWYAIYAIAADMDTTFTLKAMPFMRVKSQADQVISLGTLTTPATGIGYGFVTDELIGGSIYMLSGASKGLLRTISANNNNNATGGTITYSGDALTIAEGDWFIVLPNTNFRWLPSILNKADGDIRKFVQYGPDINLAEVYRFTSPDGSTLLVTDINIACPLALAVDVFSESSGYFNIGPPDTPTIYSVAHAMITINANIRNCEFYLGSDDGGWLDLVKYTYK